MRRQTQRCTRRARLWRKRLLSQSLSTRCVDQGLAEGWRRGVIARQMPAWRGHSTSFESYKDREVHHGEEDKSEETVHQKEEEGRSGPQEAQDDEGVSEKIDQEEEVGAPGRPKAPLGTKASGSFNARRRTGANALVESARRLRRRWRQRRLISIEHARGAAAPRRRRLHCIAPSGPIAFMETE